MSEQTYGFSSEIQFQIVAMLLADPSALVENMEVVKPSHFENPILSDAVKIIYDFFAKYHRSPSTDEFIQEFDTHISETKNIPAVDYINALGEIMAMAETAQFDFVRDKATEFSRYQAIRQAILEGAEIVKKKKNYADILEKVRSALAIGDPSKDLGSLYYENLEDRLKSRREGNTRRETAIPTGIRSLDEILGGGIGVGELGIILGPLKRGKTILSVNIGANVTQGLNSGNAAVDVIHYICEGSKDRLESSYDSKISGISKDDLKANEDVVRKEVEQWRSNKANGRLLIKHFPALSCTPQVIENHLLRARMREHIDPKLIIIDYLGLMTTSKVARDASDKYFTFGQISKELLSLAQREKLSIWLLHQSNRGARKKNIVDLDDSADSLEPLRDADVIITLNQTEEDRTKNILRLFLAGGRESRDRRMSVVKFDKNLCQIVDIGVDDSAQSDAAGGGEDN
jgi:replicative DNA helicase